MKKENLFVYFTNASLENLAGDIETRLLIRELTSSFSDNLNPFISCCETDVTCLKTIIDLQPIPDAILVYDGSGSNNNLLDYHKSVVAQLNDIKKHYERINICYHDTGTINVANYREFANEFYSLKEGHHLSGMLYSTAVNFVKKQTDAVQKASQEFEGMPILKFKLDILHRCLTLEGAKEVSNRALPKLTEQERAAFESFKFAIKNLDDSIASNYTDALRQLRDVWLN